LFLAHKGSLASLALLVLPAQPALLVLPVRLVLLVLTPCGILLVNMTMESIITLVMS
jgi:hypothetical protein